MSTLVTDKEWDKKWYDERLNVRANRVHVSDDTIRVDLQDGRSISVPLAWYPRLMNAKPAERNNVEIGHFGIHWPDLDEDVSVAGLVLGNRSGESQASLKKWMDHRSAGTRQTVQQLPLPEWAQ